MEGMNDMMNILCFGDSNTYGHIPGSGDRYDETKRWTKLLQKHLGQDYYVIEEGLNGRTTVFEDPYTNNLRGIDLLETCIATHQPLDLVILMLGTNDIKPRFNVGPDGIARGLECLLKKLRNPMVYHKDVLVVSPIHIGESIMESEFCEMFGGRRGIEISKQLSRRYEEFADLYNCHFLDAAKIAQPDERDGVHLGEEGHSLLAKALFEKVKEIEKRLVTYKL